MKMEGEPLVRLQVHRQEDEVKVSPGQPLFIFVISGGLLTIPLSSRMVLEFEDQQFEGLFVLVKLNSQELH